MPSSIHQTGWCAYSVPGTSYRSLSWCQGLCPELRLKDQGPFNHSGKSRNPSRLVSSGGLSEAGSEPKQCLGLVLPSKTGPAELHCNRRLRFPDPVPTGAMNVCTVSTCPHAVPGTFDHAARNCRSDRLGRLPGLRGGAMRTVEQAGQMRRSQLQPASLSHPLPWTLCKSGKQTGVNKRLR
jgi:hypothetical protein